MQGLKTSEMQLMSSKVESRAISDFDGLFKRAIKLRDDHRPSEAIKILRKLCDAKPASASVHGILGQIFWDEGKLDEAVSSFDKAVQLSPQSELASLGLFHTLWNKGQQQQAINEMYRFLSIKDSKDYARIARELVRTKLQDEEAVQKRKLPDSFRP